MRVLSLIPALFLLLAAQPAQAQSSREDWLALRDRTARSAASTRAVTERAAQQETSAAQENLVTGVLTLTSWRSFPDAFGGEVVVGEVQNLSGTTLSFSRAIFDFYNRGTYVGTDYNYVFGSNGRVALTGSYVPVLAPGAVGFFKVWTNLPYAGITDFVFRSEAETYDLIPVYGSFALGSIALTPDGFGGTNYAGTVRNQTAGLTTYFTMVAVAGYSAGVINDVDFTYVNGLTDNVCGTSSTSGVVPGATVGYGRQFSRPVSTVGRLAMEWDEHGILPAAQSFSNAGGSGSTTVIGNCTWSAVSNVPWIAITGSSTGTGDSTVSFIVAANNGASRSGALTIASQTFTVTQDGPPDLTITGRRAGDFNGDGRADMTVFRPSIGTWYTRLSGAGATGVQWGGSADIPVSGDYDGDGKSDVAVFRPSNGTWYMILSGSGGGHGVQWGMSGDVPVPADYDGDGHTDIAVFRPSNGVWYIRNSGSAAGVDVQWGTSGDSPVPADYDGDGRADVAVFRPANGQWYVIYSSTGAGAAVQWGIAGDIPVLGDFDADGRTDVAVFRPSDGVWYIIFSSTGAGASVQWGTVGDIPVSGDFDGDGRTDIAIFRPSNGAWYVIQSSNGGGFGVHWGMDGDVPS